MEPKSQELCVYLSVLTLLTLPIPQPSEYKVNCVVATFSSVAKCIIHLTGLLKAPIGISVEADRVNSINVPWSPPFTLEGVPILHYSVYITSQGVSEQRNTTETHISLETPCASQSYVDSQCSLYTQEYSTVQCFL